MKRIIIFTGKGGVGKSSVSAAHARKSAKEGKKTLLVSTDMAHNLSDIFEMKIGRETVSVREDLDALELDPEYIMQNDFADLMRGMQDMLASEGMGNIKNDELIMIPGMEELFCLLKLLEIYQKGVYERIIVDCAPTGETLSLLKFPELLSWYMEKFFPIGKIAVRVLSPVSKQFFKIQLPDKNAMTDIERMYKKLVELQELLKNQEITTIRLVALPEKMVVEETKRNYMYMNLYGYCVDGVIINRILEEEVENPFFYNWKKIQKSYIEELETVFGEIPITKIKWYPTDLCGVAAIDNICKEVLTEEDLFDVRTHHTSEQYEKIENGYKLEMYIPFLEKGELSLHQTNTDLIVKIGNYKRNIPIPNTLRNYEITSAKLEDQILRICFKKGEEVKR